VVIGISWVTSLETGGYYQTNENSTSRSEQALTELERGFGPTSRGRTALVTGADGLMGSYVTEASVTPGAHLHAFVRATSSGVINNIGRFKG